jgi:hypothetical protein
MSQVIGSLIYLTNTRPYICFFVNTLSQYMVEKRPVYLVAENHVLRYLKGTMDYGLWYGSDHEGFLDLYWANSVANQKSTSRCCFNLGSAMISWFSRKKSNVALSTNEAYFIASCSTSNKSVWIQKMLVGLFDLNLEATCIWCDNKSCVKFLEKSMFHEKSKHINTM